MLWDASTAVTTRFINLKAAVWSPCNKFIAITWGDSGGMVDVLDSATLQRLQTLESPQYMDRMLRALVFSPNSRFLTCSGFGAGDVDNKVLCFNSWDLQTGGVTSAIDWKVPTKRFGSLSTAYSANGGMFGGSYFCNIPTKVGNGIFTYNVTSGVLTHSPCPTSLLNPVWTHGESLRFASVNVSTITIWEVEFTSGAKPTEVETLPAPDSVDCEHEVVEFLPTPCRLALILQEGGRVLVWDARNSRYLLESADAKFTRMTSFSSDGRFFASSTTGSVIYLWKESPAGYILRGILQTSAERPRPLLAQNGESIVGYGDRTIQLWRTKGFTTPPSGISTRDHQRAGDFILEFSPDGTLAVVAVQESNTVTILNLKSGAPRLIIDTSMKVYGLGFVGNAVAVLGDQKVVTWDLPTGDSIPGARVGPEESSWTKEMKPGNLRSHLTLSCASISPDSRHVAFLHGVLLRIYSAPTGELLQDELISGFALRFSPDGCNLWCPNHSGEASVWRVSSGQNVLERSALTVSIKHPPGGYPWGSIHGYRVASDW